MSLCGEWREGKDREQICLCGSKFKLSYHGTGNDYWIGHCLICNRTLTIAGKLGFPFIFDKDSYCWGKPVDHLKCEVCSGEFFASKILVEKPVLWLKCVQCGTEKDLRN